MTFHRTLTAERWATMPARTRLLHIGAELKRLAHWIEAGDRETAEQCVARALDLLDLSVATAHPGVQRQEFCRAREIVRGVLFSPDPQREAAHLTRALVGKL